MAVMPQTLAAVPLAFSRGSRAACTVFVSCRRNRARREAEALTRRCIEAVLGGDMVAMRICMDRLVPVRGERLVILDLPPATTRGDAAKVTTALLRAVADSELAPGEALKLINLVVAHVAALDGTEKAAGFISLFPDLDFKSRK